MSLSRGFLSSVTLTAATETETANHPQTSFEPAVLIRARGTTTVDARKKEEEKDGARGQTGSKSKSVGKAR